VIIAVPTGTILSEDILEGLIQDNNGIEYGETCPTTTTTTSQLP
jgi:hypothetical protein